MIRRALTPYRIACAAVALISMLALHHRLPGVLQVPFHPVQDLGDALRQSQAQGQEQNTPGFFHKSPPHGHLQAYRTQA